MFMPKVSGLRVSGRYEAHSVAYSLQGRQLAAMGKEGMFVEDQDDACSGYSRSFFHFKPIKTYKTTLLGGSH